VAAELDRQEAAGRRVQLWTLDLDDGLAAVAVGDLDTADAVAVLVPGIWTTPEDDLAAQVGNAADVAQRAEAAAPGLAVAALAWIGYRTPQGPLSIGSRRDARAGGPALDDALAGLAAARSALAVPEPRTTVVAHSYGTVVAGEAAAAPGQLAADAVVLLGSPGGAESAAALEAPEVYDAASPLDPVSWVGWFGPDPWAAPFGATELPTDPDTLHSQYFDPDRPTLDAIAHVVVGRGHA
jgi:pimeloyl-ACP methyl ester carboxylesterase